MGKDSWAHQPSAACWGPEDDKGRHGRDGHSGAWPYTLGEQESGFKQLSYGSCQQGVGSMSVPARKDRTLGLPAQTISHSTLVSSGKAQRL